MKFLLAGKKSFAQLACLICFLVCAAPPCSFAAVDLNSNMECGIKPDAQDDTLVTLPQDTKRTRELVIYFLANSTEIPADCMERLEAISSAAKNRKIGQLLIRSSTRTDSSNELDLAIGNERLEVIKSFFRNDRLARKALILELYPIDTREQSGATLEAPRVVEIYSGPVD